MNEADQQGYRHALYAESLAEIGEPTFLQQSGGWFLKRSIPSSKRFDGMGTYPLFSCSDWDGLEADLTELKKELVAFSLVADPLDDVSTLFLHKVFEDVCYPFKTHYLVDLTRQPLKSAISKHHRRNVEKALKEVRVSLASRPLDELDHWIKLYDGLVKKHKITGPARFSPQSFRKQFAVPGLMLFKAEDAQETIGMALFYRREDKVYYHLAAYSEAGYGKRVSYAIFHEAIRYFSEQGLRWLNLGGGAGLNEKEDGLVRFKKGWSNHSKPAYFCGKILNREAYFGLLQKKKTRTDSFFPLYRSGE